MINEEIQQYYDQFDSRLINDYIKSNKRVVTAIKRIIKLTSATPSNKILDLGCGIGWSSNEISNHFPKKNVLGLDLSQELISIGKSLFNHHNLKLEQKNLMDNTIINESKYDIVSMIDVFEHIPKEDYLSFSKQLLNVLNINFCIFFSCPTINTQNQLRLNNPTALQPVDEDIDEQVLKTFASYMGANLVFYNDQFIWKENDYLHAVITNYDIDIEILNNIDQGIKLETKINKIKRIVWSSRRSFLYHQNFSTKLIAFFVWLFRIK
ncbi:MAG TPA: class I SAM-dependent methyltransferase [Saprospiraceae bacterium]|nr:class I SAM-dependent methyltransferase [Saprospiraceae bacterium]